MGYPISKYLDSYEQNLMEKTPLVYIIDILSRVLKIDESTSDTKIDTLTQNLYTEGMTDRGFAVIFTICYYLTKKRKYLIMSKKVLEDELEHKGAGFNTLVKGDVSKYTQTENAVITDALINHTKEKQCALTTPTLNTLKRLVDFMFDPEYHGFSFQRLFDKLK